MLVQCQVWNLINLHHCQNISHVRINQMSKFGANKISLHYFVSQVGNDDSDNQIIPEDVLSIQESNQTIADDMQIAEENPMITLKTEQDQENITKNGDKTK